MKCGGGDAPGRCISLGCDAARRRISLGCDAARRRISSYGNNCQGPIACDFACLLPCCRGSSVHRCLSADVAPPQKSQFCLPLIRNPQPSPRLHCIVRRQGWQSWERISVHGDARTHLGRDIVASFKLGAWANDLFWSLPLPEISVGYATFLSFLAALLMARYSISAR